MQNIALIKNPREEFSLIKEELVKVLKCLNSYNNEEEISKNVITYRLTKSLVELFDILFKVSDFKSIRSQLTLQRTIVNYYSILYLLTNFNSKEEQRLRYYLFLLDSLNSRIGKHDRIKKKTTKNILDLEGQDIDTKKNQDEKTCENILNFINEEKLHLLVEEKIISNKNWKFKSPQSKKRNEYYNYCELAEIARIPSRYAMFYQDYASDFVHGIGSSLMIKDDDNTIKQVISSTLEFSSVLMCLIIKILLTEFTKELKFVNINSHIQEKIIYFWENK